MKHAVILHATDEDHQGHWYPWLQQQLEASGYDVWVPDLPGADKPNVKRYNKFLLNSEWDFTNSVIIGHSSGAVEILGLLQALPSGVKVGTVILVGSFSEVLADDPEWEQLKGLFETPFDFSKITEKAQRFIFVHGSNDPWCPMEQAKYLCKQVGGTMRIIAGGQHFSTNNDPKWKTFPELLKIIKETT